MNADELEMFMSAVAIGDRRTTGRYDVGYWAAMAQEGRWTLPTAMRALVIFRTQNPGEWIDPGHITSIIRDARRQAAMTFAVPDEQDDLKPADLPRWHRAQLAAHQDRLLTKWAAGEPLPVTTAGAVELTGFSERQLAARTDIDMITCPPELRAQFLRDKERAGRNKPDRRRLTFAVRRFVGDPGERAKAIAELDAKRAEREAS